MGVAHHDQPLKVKHPQVGYFFVIFEELKSIAATTKLRLGVTPDVPLSPDGPCVDRSHLPKAKAGKLSPLHIQTRVRAAAGAMRACYEAGLARNPKLVGKVKTRFVVGTDGSVEDVTTVSNSLPDCEVVECVSRVFAGLKFDQPTGGKVTVVYPLVFEPAVWGP